MADLDKPPVSSSESARHLEESLSSERITEAEADVVKLFFASPPQKWPANELQRRMQSSGG